MNDNVLRNSGLGRPPERECELFLAAASFMEPRPPSFYGLRELARELEKAYPELGKVVPSTLLRAFERFCDLPPRSPNRHDRVLYRIRVSHLLGHGYYAARHEGPLFQGVSRVLKESEAYRRGGILLEDLTSPWRGAVHARCRGCGKLRDLELRPSDPFILCAACRGPGGTFYAAGLKVRKPNLNPEFQKVFHESDRPSAASSLPQRPLA